MTSCSALRLGGASVPSTCFSIGGPHCEHRGYGAGNAEGLGVRGGLCCENMLVNLTIISILQGLLGCEVSLAVSNGVERFRGGELIEEGLLPWLGLVG